MNLVERCYYMTDLLTCRIMIEQHEEDELNPILNNAIKTGDVFEVLRVLREFDAFTDRDLRQAADRILQRKIKGNLYEKSKRIAKYITKWRKMLPGYMSYATDVSHVLKWYWCSLTGVELLIAIWLRYRRNPNLYDDGLRFIAVCKDLIPGL